jgi:hypothetical protein
MMMDRSVPQSVDLATASDRYTLSASELQSAQVQMNGDDLKLGSDDTLAPLIGVSIAPGQVTFAPATITFLAIPNAKDASCRQSKSY